MADQNNSTDVQASILLASWFACDPATRDSLVSMLYGELRRLAHHYMQGERAGHTLQTTALVNEAYLRLASLERMQWRDRSHFFATAAILMRRILVDHARERGRDKRGGQVVFTTLDAERIGGPQHIDVLALDEALERLAAIDPLPARVVELRFFGDLTIEETAVALGISPATVKREWTWAKAWLYQRLVGT
jgi:RNA polymerase sigma-70 factor, ECF subfamily